MNLTCLVENTTANAQLIAQHGLSVYLEVGGKKLLLDFGQTGDALFHNANALGVDLASVELAVLSHGHYDHSGGLEAFLQINPTAQVYLHQNAFGEYYNGTHQYIGVNPALKQHPRLCFVGEDTPIAPGITLRMPKNHLVAPLRHGGLTQKVNGLFLPDSFDHELYLEVEEKGKRVLLSGCAHKGIENIMAWFSPQIFVGGMHLSHYPLDDSFAKLSQTLGDYKAHYLTGHCTGVEQFEFLKQRNCQISYFSCGKALAL